MRLGYGEEGGSSWLIAVKRAFRSPTKETDKRGGRRREEHDREEDEKSVDDGGGVAPVNDDVSAAACRATPCDCGGGGYCSCRRGVKIQ
ncbi:hypothetical protein CK203_010080 [Vitis vinifera]|uniref:Uncharacterized protein n=1 Tax=Vitis vinifera TaxID=29760 RepID=A0A438JXG5_VITVI|nr:hypothetical protein CK203_010080 [Vitis vinifera]